MGFEGWLSIMSARRIPTHDPCQARSTDAPKASGALLGKGLRNDSSGAEGDCQGVVRRLHDGLQPTVTGETVGSRATLSSPGNHLT
jgi:hypothetical protein